MKRLVFNGRWERFLQIGQQFEEFLVGNDGIVVHEYLDVIYHLDYTDFSPDLIVIHQGDYGIHPDPTAPDLGERFSNWVERLSKAAYFPVELGKICKEICKEKGKQEPKILILTSSKKRIEKFVQEEANYIDLLDPASLNFMKDLKKYLKE